MKTGASFLEVNLIKPSSLATNLGLKLGDILTELG